MVQAHSGVPVLGKISNIKHNDIKATLLGAMAYDIYFFFIFSFGPFIPSLADHVYNILTG
jgi:hypothetical protein